MNLLASLLPPAPLDLSRRALAQLPIPDDGTKWILIGAAMLVITYVVIRPMGKRRKDPLERGGASSASSSSGSSGLSQQRAVEREMSNLLVELSQMSRQITGQLDTRAAKLELLIKEADEKIARLEALQDAAETREGRPAVVMRSVSGVSGGDLHDRDVVGAAGDVLDPRGERIDPRHAQIYALADEGRGPRDIARELGRPTGEVELILALRPSQPAR
jgi:hypothetical protein